MWDINFSPCTLTYTMAPLYTIFHCECSFCIIFIIWMVDEIIKQLIPFYIDYYCPCLQNNVDNEIVICTDSPRNFFPKYSFQTLPTHELTPGNDFCSNIHSSLEYRWNYFDFRDKDVSLTQNYCRIRSWER